MKVKRDIRKGAFRGVFDKINKFLFPDVLPHAAESGTVAAWAGVIVAVGSAAYGAYSSSKTNRQNKALAGQSRDDELARREAIAGEIEKAMGEYNALRKERPGLTVKEWMKGKLEALNDPQFEMAFRQAKEKDFIQAQSLADQATKGNIDTYQVALDHVSGGKAMELLAKRNEIALTSDSVSAYERALELQSPKIPAGSVAYDKTGRLIEGQRADKQTQTIAYEVDKEARDRQFRMSRDIINDDRAAAQRQQEKATSFLQFTDFTGYASNTADQAMNAAINYQMKDEAFQGDLIKTFYNAAFSNQTQQPQYQSTGQSDALVAQGIGSAIKGIANIYANRNTGTATQFETPGYSTPSYNTPVQSVDVSSGGSIYPG